MGNIGFLFDSGKMWRLESPWTVKRSAFRVMSITAQHRWQLGLNQAKPSHLRNELSAHEGVFANFQYILRYLSDLFKQNEFTPNL